jgi:hypothetical protein
MKLWSNDWTNGESIPERFAAGRLLPDGGVGFGDNISPHLAWSGVPPGTRSLALICSDFDVPSRGDDVYRSDREVPADLPRVDFYHWALIDILPSITTFAEGEWSHGFTPRGKPGPSTLHGARHGLNDYTGWFATGAVRSISTARSRPSPTLVHHYVRAVRAECRSLAGGGPPAPRCDWLADRVLGSATLSGTTLNRRLRGWLVEIRRPLVGDDPAPYGHASSPPRRDRLERARPAGPHRHTGPVPGGQPERRAVMRRSHRCIAATWPAPRRLPGRWPGRWAGPALSTLACASAVSA